MKKSNNTQRDIYFDSYKDLKGHCDACVAGKMGCPQTAIHKQHWKQCGYLWEEREPKKSKYLNNKLSYWKEFCPKCGRKTTHRRLLSLKPKRSHIRAPLSERLKNKVIKLYKGADAFDNTVFTDPVEVDHRIPRVTYTSDEHAYSHNISDEKLMRDFMLLTPHNNLLKSRKCERCQKTGIRPASRDGVEYYFKGTKKYNKKIGCDGCFWAYPEKWREAVNNKLCSKKR